MGDLAMLPFVGLLGSYVVQTHLGYAILVAYLGLWAIIGLTIVLGGRWRVADVGERRRIIERLCIWMGLTILVTTLAWWAPVHEQLYADNGNLAVLTESMQRNDNLPVGFADAGGFLSREIGGLAPWTTLGESEGGGPSMPVEPEGLAALLVPAIPFAVALALAVWRRERDAVFLQVTAFVAVGASFLAFAMVDGMVLAYLVRWSWPVGLLVWLSTFWSLYRATGGHLRTAVRFVGAPALALTLVLVSSANVDRAADASVPIADVSEQLLDMEDDVVEAVEDHEPVHIITGDGTLGAYAVAVGLQLILEKEGVPIVVPSGDSTRYGDHRTRDDVEPGSNLIVVTDNSVPLVRQSPELELVAHWQPRTDDQEREFINLHTLEDQERLTEEAEDRLAELRRRSHGGRLPRPGPRVALSVEDRPVEPRVGRQLPAARRSRTLRVICSICGSRPARPWAQSVDPEVTTVPPPGFVYEPRTAWPNSMRSVASGSRVPNSRDATNSSSAGSSGAGGRTAVSRVKCAAGAVPRISRSSGVPSAPVGYGRPSR
ncbi:MAG: hypothetical protein U5R31_06480 [Acidimicrobiia bacterium]|nr:hypothetical protein [Acidimicrobiia bacterium]